MLESKERISMLRGTHPKTKLRLRLWCPALPGWFRDQGGLYEKREKRENEKEDPRGDEDWYLFRISTERRLFYMLDVVLVLEVGMEGSARKGMSVVARRTLVAR